MTGIRRLILQFAACALLPVFLCSAVLADEYRFSNVSRVVAMSDPHGAYDAMVQTLANAGVVDDAQQWSAGETHLVITGDLLDRGADSRRIMDLVMRLESEAADSGGMVHLTLGNHELMNLVGDLRYVARGEFAAFAGEEDADEREEWFQRFRSENVLQDAVSPDDSALRAAFDKNRPPGFYGHRQAFSSEGKYGRWLLQKPLMVVVNDTAFVHGGLPPMVAELTLDSLNQEMGAQVGDYVRQLEVLNSAGLVDPATGFYAHVGAAEQLVADPSSTAEIRAAAQTVIDLNAAPVHDPEGPVWYRGSVSCSILSEGDVLASALQALGANRLVVGHTPTVTRQVMQRFDGRVIEIDTGMLKSSYNGSGNALVLEGDTVAVINESGSNPIPVEPHPRRVGPRSVGLTTEYLETLLATGEVASTGIDALGRTVVTIPAGSISVQAIFTEGPRRKGTNAELAAYRLDRLLRLDMIPVTVARELNGRAGTLQFLPANTRDEAYRVAGGQSSAAQCPLPRQWNSMYIFDALIFNDSRSANSMVYDPGTWQLMSIGHAKALSTKRGVPKYLAEIPLQLTSTWIEALSGLTDEVLAQNLGDVLDKRRINALAKRRDALIAQAAQQD